MLSSIKIKILTTNIALVLLAMSSMWVASYFLMAHYITISQKRTLQYFADFKVEELEDYFTQIKDLAERTTDSREFKDFNITAKNLPLIELFTKFNKMFSVVTYVNKEGQEEVKVVKGKLSDRPLANISKDPVFQDSLRQRNKIVISPVRPSPELGEPVICLMLSKYTYFGDGFSGTLVGAIPISQIDDMLKEDKVEKFGFVSLIDNNGIILSYPRKDKIFTKITGEGKKAEKLILDSERLNAGFDRANILGIDGFVAYAPLKETGWSVLVTLPYRDFMAAPNNLKKALKLIFVLITILSVLISLYLSNRITKPMLQLVSVTKAVTKGDFSKRAQAISRDEIGSLASAFNIMTENLQKTTVSMEVLKEEQKRFTDVANNSGEWIWEVNSEGRYTYNSPMVEKILGYKPEEVLGKYFYDFFHPEEREQLKKAAFEAFSRREIFLNFLNRNIHKDGHTVFLETSGVPLLADNGNLLGYRGVDRDITERKKTEEQQTLLLKDLEDINRIMVGRELKMIELKKEINILSQELGRPAPYDETSLGQGD